MTTAEKT